MARVYARFPCRLRALVQMPRIAAVEGLLCNIGMGGALLSMRAGIAEGQKLRLRVDCDSESFEFDAVILRDTGSDSKNPRCSLYGLSFVEGERSRRQVNLIVDRVRQKSDASGAPPVSDYWKK